MIRFKIWLEDFKTQQDREVHQIWADTFKALGIGGLSDEDAAQQSLSKITYGQRAMNHTDTFKGKQAALKRLENAQIFPRLEKLSDPLIRKGIEDAKKWLSESDDKANASTTVSVLLQKLFGEKFHQLIDSSYPKVADQAQAQVQPQPPKNDNPQIPPDLALGPENPKKPQNPADQQVRQPQQAPMPPMPAGAQAGLY